jgi:hypothetical protein
MTIILGKLVTHSHSKKVDGKKGGRSVVNGKKPFASFKVSSDSLRKNPLLIGATTQSHTLENNHNLLSDVNTNSALSMVKPRKMISCLDDVTATELSSDTCPTTSADEFALESLQTRPKRRKTVDGERKFPTSLSRKKQIVGPLENGKKQALQRRNRKS